MRKNKEAKMYLVNFSMMGSGCLEVLAHSAKEAKELAWDTSTKKLLKNCDFEDSFEIESVEKDI